MDKQFLHIAEKIQQQGWCIVDNALPQDLASALHQHVTQLPPHAFKAMGIGRGHALRIDKSYRSDTSHWLDGDTQAEQDYLAWMEKLRLAVNQCLFMGLFDYESHFAHYAPGAFYKRHLDAFKGNTNRVLTTVFYLNPEWDNQNGGEILLYEDADSQIPFQTVSPNMGKLVIFLSNQFPHEVISANRSRYSIAGWFRVKT